MRSGIQDLNRLRYHGRIKSLACAYPSGRSSCRSVPLSAINSILCPCFHPRRENPAPSTVRNPKTFRPSAFVSQLDPLPPIGLGEVWRWRRQKECESRGCVGGAIPETPTYVCIHPIPCWHFRIMTVSGSGLFRTLAWRSDMG